MADSGIGKPRSQAGLVVVDLVCPNCAQPLTLVLDAGGVTMPDGAHIVARYGLRCTGTCTTVQMMTITLRPLRPQESDRLRELNVQWNSLPIPQPNSTSSPS